MHLQKFNTYLIFTYLSSLIFHLFLSSEACFVQLFRLDPQNNHSFINRHDMEAYFISHVCPYTHILSLIAYIWWQSCVVEFFSLICNFSIWLRVFVVFLADAIALIITNRMLGNARHQQHRYKHTAMRDRNKSALAFSHWETYYYRVVQSQTLCMLLLSLYFYSPYTLHTHVALCMLVFWNILVQKIQFCDTDEFTPIFLSFFSQSKLLFSGFVVNPL